MARNTLRDRYRFDILRDGPVTEGLGAGQDEVVLRARDKVVDQIRLTFNRSEVGDGNPALTIGIPGQSPGLAVSMQAEDAAGTAFGPISRFDDEGITFRSRDVKFDVRDLSAASSTTLVDVVVLGTSGADDYDFRGEDEDHYVHGGMGDDRAIGGSGNDYLIGGFGNDLVRGGPGDDLLVGLAGVDTFVFSGDPGHDTILTYQPGTDRIDLSAFGISPGNVQATQTGLNTLIKVDSNADGGFDFEIFLGGSAPPTPADYIF